MCHCAAPYSIDHSNGVYSDGYVAQPGARTEYDPHVQDVDWRAWRSMTSLALTWVWGTAPGCGVAGDRISWACISQARGGGLLGKNWPTRTLNDESPAQTWGTRHEDKPVPDEEMVKILREADIRAVAPGRQDGLEEETEPCRALRALLR